MKSIIFAILLFFAIAFGFQKEAKSQDETFFTIGDTTETFSVSGNPSRVFITVVDSSIAGTDTVFVQVKQNGVVTVYGQLAVHDANATAQATNVVSMIPGDTKTGIYWFNVSDIPGGTFRIVRSNESTNDLYAPKTRIFVNYK